MSVDGFEPCLRPQMPRQLPVPMQVSWLFIAGCCCEGTKNQNWMTSFAGGVAGTKRFATTSLRFECKMLRQHQTLGKLCGKLYTIYNKFAAKQSPVPFGCPYFIDGPFYPFWYLPRKWTSMTTTQVPQRYSTASAGPPPLLAPVMWRPDSRSSNDHWPVMTSNVLMWAGYQGFGP